MSVLCYGNLCTLNGLSSVQKLYSGFRGWWYTCIEYSNRDIWGAWEQPPRGAPWVSGLVRHFVQIWPDSELLSHSAVLRLKLLELTLQSLSPVLALYDPFRVDVPLNSDTTTTDRDLLNIPASQQHRISKCPATCISIFYSPDNQIFWQVWPLCQAWYSF